MKYDKVFWFHSKESGEGAIYDGRIQTKIDSGFSVKTVWQGQCTEAELIARVEQYDIATPKAVTIIPDIDKSGKRIARFKKKGERGFSIQTNGNLPLADRLPLEKWQDNQLTLLTEAQIQVSRHGTSHQFRFLS